MTAPQPAGFHDTPFTRHAKVRVPLICGPMYPCSNPELVAAVGAAGALGIVQPIALTYVHKHDFREGLRLINRLSHGAPMGFNALSNNVTTSSVCICAQFKIHCAHFKIRVIAHNCDCAEPLR